MTIFEFTNQDKVSFFSTRTSPNFSHFPFKLKRGFLFYFALERNPKNIFYYKYDLENYTDPVLGFLLFDKHEYTHGIMRYIFLVSIFMFTRLSNFFFVPQDLTDRINSYFQIIAFRRNLLLIGLTFHVTSFL